MQDLREIKWRCLSCMSWHLLSFLLRFVLLSLKRSSSFVFYFLCFIDIWWPREDSLGGSITNSIEFGDGNSLCTSDPSLPHSWWDCKNIYPLLTLLSIITALNHVKEMSHKFSMSLFWRIPVIWVSSTGPFYCCCFCLRESRNPLFISVFFVFAF